MLFAVACAAAWAEQPREIILRSLTSYERDLDARKNYTFLVRNEQRRMDGEGRPKSVKSETHEVLILYGASYRRLVARNDQPLTPEEEREEQRKLDKELERRKRAAAKDPGQLAREDERTLEEHRKLMREIADAYTFSIVGEKPVGGHPTWVIDAEPRPDFRPRTERGRILPAFRGRLWITKEDYRWAKVEAEAIRTVSFGWILARLQPGSQIAFEQRRLEEELWMPTAARMRILARLALIKKYDMEVEVTFSDYRKFQSDSRIVDISPLGNASTRSEP
jgi:hypothetical protein